MADSLKSQAKSSVIWSTIQQFGNQGISFIVSMILARLLEPEEFGILAMIYIFTGVSSILVSGGLGSSLIRTEKPEHTDFSTVFVFNLIGSFLIYIILFLVAPYISDFYKQPILVEVIRLYCLIFVINALTTVQIIRLQKALNFKEETIATILATGISGVVGVGLAYRNFGVMSLVWMGIVGAAVKSIYIWCFSDWRPSLLFNKEKFRKHFKFGVNLTFTGLLDVVFENIYNIYIGRFYSPAQLGYYNRADSLKQLPVSNVLGVISKVTYPLFANVSSDTVRLKSAYKQIMQMITFVMVPLMAIACALAKPLIIVLFSEKWLPSVPYFQILCIVAVFYPLRVYNTNIFLVKGRSDLFFKLEIVKKIFYIIIFLSVIKFGIYGLLWGMVIFNITSYVIESYFAGKFIEYSFVEQFKDILPILILGILITVLTQWLFLLLQKLNFSIIVYLILCTLISSITYLLIAKIFKLNALKTIVQLKNK